MMKIEFKEKPSLEDEEALFEGIAVEAARKRGLTPMRTFSLFLKREDADRVFGGVTGYTYYGCLYIDMLWVEESVRNQGWGTKLMHGAEEIGKERGCSFAILQTMDWEALPLYQKLGYRIEYTREGYEKGAKMHLLRKPLSPPVKENAIESS